MVNRRSGCSLLRLWDKSEKRSEIYLPRGDHARRPALHRNRDRRMLSDLVVGRLPYGMRSRKSSMLIHSLSLAMASNAQPCSSDEIALGSSAKSRTGLLDSWSMTILPLCIKKWKRLAACRCACDFLVASCWNRMSGRSGRSGPQLRCPGWYDV